ncbi:MAG: AmpG family muropeptide MFS transporter [Bdellovibrionota bacterium]
MSAKGFFKEFFSKKMLLIFFMGFSSGLPLLLTSGTLKIWLAREQIDISMIGYFSWVGLSYSLKFIWAPLLDRFSFFGWGRRRSWMLMTQACLMVLISSIFFFNPANSLHIIAGISVLIAFFSATQDIAIDAYRREYLEDAELGMGSSVNQYGYRIAMLLSGGLGIGMVGSSWAGLTWQQLYLLMGVLMSLGMVATCLAPEPKVEKELKPKTLKSAVLDPFKEFLTRDKAFVILLFVFLFKLGDALSGAMLSPFYVQMGYSNEDIGLIAKTFGLISSLVGLFIGGAVIYSVGIYRSLVTFGILQALSTASFALITFTGPAKWALAFAVCFEDISSGMGSAAFLAYLATITNKRYTATQYAILSSLATSGRNFFSGFSGNMVKALDWANFFYVCALIAIPGLLMLFVLGKVSKK